MRVSRALASSGVEFCEVRATTLGTQGLRSRVPEISAMIASALLIVFPAVAQDSPAPPPTTSLFPAGYLNHEALTASLKRLEAEHPESVRVSSLARTLQGRDVWLVTVGRAGASKSDPPQPAILI